MSVKSQAKDAVVSAYNLTKSVWIDITFVDVQKVKHSSYKDHRKDSTNESVVACLPTENKIAYIKEDGKKIKKHVREFLLNPDDLTIDLGLIDKIKVGAKVFNIDELEYVNEYILIKLKVSAGG